MITHLRTKGFKGFDLDEDIPYKVIYTGPNTAGKSARAGAIALALLNHIPWEDSGKDINKIVDSYSPGDEFGVAITIGDTELGKKFKKGKKKPACQVSGKPVSAENFQIALGAAGNPKIADVTDFMRQSEAKKIDTLFDLYPNPELENIDLEIEKAKAEIKHINTKISGAESTIQRLTTSKNQLELPPGSIAEIQAEIVSIDQQIADLQNQIKQAEIKEAQEKAKAEGARQEREKMIVENETGISLKTESFLPEDEISLRTDEEWEQAGIDFMPSSPQMQETDRIISDMEKQMDGFKSGEISSDIAEDLSLIGKINKQIVRDSIQLIIDALTGSGCSTCAALIVAKLELKKYGGNHEN